MEIIHKQRHIHLEFKLDYRIIKLFVMKNITNKIRLFSCILFIVFVSTSCEDFLEEDPKDRVAITNYYETEDDAISAVNSIYAWLGSYDLAFGNTAGIYHSTFWVTAGLASDEMNNNQVGQPQLDQLATFGYNSENAAVLEMWQIHYKAINTANIAIGRIPDIDMDLNLKDRLVNEAKFLRGLLYFNLVRMFGNVPLLTQETEPLNPESVPSEDIYTQIILDLEAAEALPISYPKGNGLGRATSGAAKALLAKVYLTQGKYQDCVNKAKEVITSNHYDLWDNYSDVFKLANRNGKEAIFSVGFGDAGGAISFWEVGQFNVRLLPAELTQEIPEISNTQGWQVATDYLYNSYDVTDTRREATFMLNFNKKDGTIINLDKIYFQKYWDKDADPTASGSSNDFPVLRYADVLLMYAEACAQVNEFTDANKYLNIVRKRAGLSDLNITNTNDFANVILCERYKEFACEGQRWFDLVRTKQLTSKVNAAKGINPGEKFNLFPIPLRERDLNSNLPQNQGY